MFVGGTENKRKRGRGWPNFFENIGMLYHALGHEFDEPWWQQTLFWTQAQHLHFLWFNLVYLIWYYYFSVKFVMWIVKQKIDFFKKIGTT